MKKFLTILVVALIATSTVFAGLSGSAAINLGANFDSGAWGFANSTSLSKLSLTWQSAEAGNVGEGEIYAGIKASFEITSTTTKKASFDEVVALNIEGSISEAYITDGEMKISILGAASTPDYATSAAIDGSSNKRTYKSAYAKAPGIKITYGNSTVGLGAAGNWKTGVIDWSIYAEEKGIVLAEGLTMNLATAISDNTEFADSIKVAYEGAFKASVAADLGWTAKAKNFDFDMAANAAYKGFEIDAYYWYSKKDISVAASQTIDAITLSVSGAINYGTKAWSAGVSGKYVADAYTAKASVDLSESAKKIILKGSVESSKIVDGATLKVAYTSANLLEKGFGKIDTSCTISF